MAQPDVLVIGGGIAGTSAAYHLARHGRAVTLLERGEIASEASGVNAGAIDCLGWGDAPNLQSHLTAGSLEIFTALQLDLGYDIELRHSGALQAIHTLEQYEFSRDRVQRLRAQGYRVELLTTRQARSIEPTMSPDLLGAFYSPLRAQADPRKATRALAAAAQASGAQILTGHEVTAIDQDRESGYRVETPRGVFRAAAVVLAAGAWCGPIGAMLGLRIPIVPVRGQMWATPSVPPALFHTLSSAESALCWARNHGGDGETPPDLTHLRGRRVTRHLYGRQTRAGEIIFGGDRELVGYDTRPTPAGIEVNRRHAAEVVPIVATLPVVRTWAGLMPFSMDGQPLIGRLPRYEGLYIVSGLASSGFGRGPMAGKLVADYVHAGRMPSILAEADPARCVTAAE